MPNLAPSPPDNASAIRTYLKGVIPDSQLMDARVHPEYEPLLLMQTRHVMAAFAFANGDMSKSYEALYKSFKEHYSKQEGRWDALDLSFVFCVRPDDPDLDQFCSRVETDVYFCRKFVVPLEISLDASLARLPFLPLTRLPGQSMRPPSAQTFLQKCGVPPVLAKYLVVPRERSPERIAEECTNGTFGDLVVPRLSTKPALPATNTSVVHGDRIEGQVRLKNLQIKNFRAYRKAQTFDLAADVTILYGPNGFGKTSFFDAIDFAATGEIGRIKRSGDTHFNKTAKHLDSKAEESVVSLSFSSNGTIRKITRSISDRRQGLLDGHVTDRKGILAELTGGSSPGTDRVENFVSLFRATHLFSQEHQEFAKDFQHDCELSEQIVSHLLAFEDYSNAVKKASGVRDVTEAIVNQASSEIQALLEQIVDEKAELERLDSTAKEHRKTGELDLAIKELQERVQKIGIQDTQETIDISTVRGWRASIERRDSESQSRVVRLSALAKDAVAMPGTAAELERLRLQLSKAEKAIELVEKRRAEAENKLGDVEQRVAAIIANRAEVQRQSNSLEWIRATQPIYAALLSTQRGLKDELGRTLMVRDQYRESESQAREELETYEQESTNLKEALIAKRADLEALQKLKEAAIGWQASHMNIERVNLTAKAANEAIDLLRKGEEQLTLRLANVAGEESRLIRMIADVDQNGTELKRLVSQLQLHVHTGTCPLCGEDHGSKTELLKRIQEHVALDAASETRTTLSQLQEEIKALSERAEINKEAIKRKSSDLIVLKDERNRHVEEIAKFEDAAAQRGIPINTSVELITQDIQNRMDRTQQELAETNKHIQQKEERIREVLAHLATIRGLLGEVVNDIARHEASLTESQSQITQLVADPRLGSLSLEMKEDELTPLLRRNADEGMLGKTALAKADAEASQSRPVVESLRMESAALKAEMPNLRSQVARAQKALAEMTSRFAQSKMGNDSSEAAILALLSEESRLQAQFVELRDLAVAVELAMDTATTAAALTRLRQNVVNKEKAVKAATLRRDQHQPWVKYFEVVSGLVSTQQNEAISHFTREYGPRTSVIQRRLRSVYGFEEIEIHSHDSTIRVRVRRRGEELRPTDYFSQSQQQTLLLGLFLTACLSQTWSTLSPIFLDDPVTHFDDLNTYAFLDLILGLLESDPGQRQFVISTCDEKFLQLARQKFRHLGERARFYSFSAIGAEGPVVREMGQLTGR